MDDPWIIGPLLGAGFLVLFSAVWLLITGLLAKVSGWGLLQTHFPDRPRDRVLEKWRFASATVGKSLVGGVSYSRCLTVEACQGGLRIKIWRIFGPFSAPLYVPWSQLKAVDAALWTTFLVLGEKEIGCLRIMSSFGLKIEAASLGQFRMPSA